MFSKKRGKLSLFSYQPQMRECICHIYCLSTPAKIVTWKAVATTRTGPPSERMGKTHARCWMAQSFKSNRRYYCFPSSRFYEYFWENHIHYPVLSKNAISRSKGFSYKCSPWLHLGSGKGWPGCGWVLGLLLFPQAEIRLLFPLVISTPSTDFFQNPKYTFFDEMVIL